MSIFVIKFEKNGSVIKEWFLEGNEDLEISLIEMLDIDFLFINKIRGFEK